MNQKWECLEDVKKGCRHTSRLGLASNPYDSFLFKREFIHKKWDFLFSMSHFLLTNIRIKEEKVLSKNYFNIVKYFIKIIF